MNTEPYSAMPSRKLAKIPKPKLRRASKRRFNSGFLAVNSIHRKADSATAATIDSLTWALELFPVLSSRLEDRAGLLSGGQQLTDGDMAKGYFVPPTVFADVKDDMRIAREEIFGPGLSVFTWRDEQEALTLANSTEYGLTASIFTNDLDAAFRAARAIKSGYIWINGASGHFYGTPFGGYKNSGLGREEGIDELLSYTETKTIHLMLGAGAAKD